MSNIIQEVVFEEFQHLTRFAKEHCVVTEKIDGTNAQIFINDLGTIIKAGSRNRWVTPGDDNFGFANWVEGNKEELMKLGPGRHFGEWWGSGIQRGYGLKNGEKRFSLFNVGRWGVEAAVEFAKPACCGVVPLITKTSLDTLDVNKIMKDLQDNGSRAMPGWMKPEGIVIYMPNSKAGYKMTFEGDKHKWELTK